MTPLRGRLPALALVALWPAAACGGGGGGSSPSAPSQPSSAASVNLAGSWKGDAADSSGPGQITVQLTQSGTSVTGSASFSLTGTSVTGRGTFTGTLSGANIHVTISVPAGGWDAPYPTCTTDVSGDGQASATSITAAYTGTSSCTGAIAAGQLTLTKQ